MFTIIGSGFGLYGYLPALVDSIGQRIVLPYRYRSRVYERPELIRLTSKIEWVVDEDTALNSVDGVVLALPPMNQHEIIPKCLTYSNTNRLLLEKPLAHTPDASEEMFDVLIRSKKLFRIGYTFRYTFWGEQLLNNLKVTNEISSLSFKWTFLAHHFRNDLDNWKRFNETGGGVIRFYGIHVIALLSEIGYRDVLSSEVSGSSFDESEKWIAVFSGTDLPPCEVCVDSKSSNNKFIIEYTSPDIIPEVIPLVEINDPFEPLTENKLQDNDQRVGVLSKLCKSLDESETIEYEWYSETINLWRNIENKTKFIPKY